MKYPLHSKSCYLVTKYFLFEIHVKWHSKPKKANYLIQKEQSLATKLVVILGYNLT